MERLLLLAHYSTLRSACRNIGALDTLAAKLSVAMLRHTDILPADKAYYEAGLDAKVNISFFYFILCNNAIEITREFMTGRDVLMS
jgi:intraflagellar transport protein 172